MNLHPSLPFPSRPSILGGRVNQVKPTLIRSTVIYCSRRPLLVCHDNYMISDCWCREGGRGAGGGAHVRVRGTRGASHARCVGNRCCCGGAQSFMCESFFVFPPAAAVLRCTSRPRCRRRRRPAADLNLSAASAPGFYIIPDKTGARVDSVEPTMCVSGFRTRRARRRVINLKWRRERTAN